MKWLSILILSISLAGCTIDVRPLTSGKEKRENHGLRKQSKKTLSPIVNDGSVTVSAEWIESYKSMESDFNYASPDDIKIKPVGGKFIIPRTVYDHFSDMARAKPTP